MLEEVVASNEFHPQRRAGPGPIGHDYLAPLNAEQRLAVEHGIGTPVPDGAGALLIIAGAGSGKTNALAFRVAHLLANGADPQRILLLTFSRRAAAELERRSGQIVSRVLGDRGLEQASGPALVRNFP